MRRLIDMECQIEITNACVMQCANCTRFCGHHPKAYFLTREQVTQALQSLKGHPDLVGIMGGEPLLHPDFEWICEEARRYFPRQQLGLWTGLPKNEKFVTDYMAKFGHMPSNFAAQAYDAPGAIAAGVKAAGGKVDDTAALAKAMRAAPLDSVRGSLKWPSKRNSAKKSPTKTRRKSPL